MNASASSRIALGTRDISEGVRSLHIWPMLGWQDIKQRYRRSVLGPFWLTITTGALIAGMGPLYGRLLRLDVHSYFPYLAIGFVVWQLMAGIISDSCGAFISAEGYIKEVKLPLTVHVLRVVWKNVLIFAHNFVIVVLVIAIYVGKVTPEMVLVVPGVLLIALNGVWAGLLFGLLCARFRDIPQVVASLVQVLFFLTPIMWKAEMLGRHQWAVFWNPLYHFLEITRTPLLGTQGSWLSWAVALGITVAGFLVSVPVFSRYRARVAYWM